MTFLILLFQIGSATTIIGDPTGRKLAKEALSLPEIYSNATSISKQIEKLYLKGMELSKSEGFKTLESVDNFSWFKDLKLIDFLTELGRQVKVNVMLSRNWYKFEIISILFNNYTLN